MSIIYTAKATATGGRDGRVATDDNKIATTLSVPGGKGDGQTPSNFSQPDIPPVLDKPSRPWPIKTG